MDTIVHTVQVDSRDRGSTTQDANNYVMHLTEPVKHIKDVIIRDIQVPNSTYNVVDGANTFEISVLTATTVTIEPGSYSGLDLASHIFNITSAQPGMDATWNVVYRTGSKKFVFTQAAGFNITFQAGSETLMDTLGFNSTGVTFPYTISALDLTIAGTAPTYYSDDLTLQNFVLASDRIANLVKDKYFYLEIAELGDPRVQTAKRSDATGFAGNNLSRIFGKVPAYAGPGSDIFFDRNSAFKLNRSYVSPLSSLARLSVKWMNYKGDLLNFNGIDDNSFTLELICENRANTW